MIPKFRAFIIAEKRHLPVALIDFNDKIVWCGDENNPNRVFDFDEIILEEFIGKYESEDIDFYENDRVKFKVKRSINPQGWEIGQLIRIGAKYIIYARCRHFDITNNIIELVGHVYEGEK